MFHSKEYYPICRNHKTLDTICCVRCNQEVESYVKMNGSFSTKIGSKKMIVQDPKVETVVRISKNIEKLFQSNISITMTSEEREKHERCMSCNLCKIVFSSITEKVIDPCQLTGRFRQTLCSKWNLQLRMPNFVPGFIHNLSTYNAHFIVTELGYDKRSITVTSNSQKKYISLSKHYIEQIHQIYLFRIIDTFRFTASSLPSLASNLHRHT